MSAPPAPSYVSGTSSIALLGETIGDILARAARMFPDHEALVECWTGRRWTYAELDHADPRCHAPGGLERALRATNRWPVPIACPMCAEEQVLYRALLPARVAYEGRRADRARTSTDPHDEGFHGYRVDCRDCGTVSELIDSCPLCSAPGPLRARPG